jgi:hypothetical protein
MKRIGLLFTVGIAAVGGAQAQVAEFGDASTRRLSILGSSQDGLEVPRDLDFNPERPHELWVVNQAFDGTVMFTNAGLDSQASEKRIDAYAAHFMEEVSSMSFGDASTFATCQESRNTMNGHHPGNDFMGPTLWPSDLEIYARVNQEPGGLLGSHIDMLHQSPNCMGIEHNKLNEYWVADGLNGHVVYYDFAIDHGPGHDDHRDGKVRRYPEAALTRVEGVPSHMVLDHSTNWLYIADAGGKRVIRLDITSGRKTRTLQPRNEPLAEFSEYTEAKVEVVASNLQQPSGVAITGGKLFVTDHKTGEIIAYSLDSKAELGRMQTEGPGIMGIAVSPDEKLWYVNGKKNILVRVDP